MARYRLLGLVWVSVTVSGHRIYMPFVLRESSA
jgi:hypothetical protein